MIKKMGLVQNIHGQTIGRVDNNGMAHMHNPGNTLASQACFFSNPNNRLAFENNTLPSEGFNLAPAHYGPSGLSKREEVRSMPPLEPNKNLLANSWKPEPLPNLLSREKPQPLIGLDLGATPKTWLKEDFSLYPNKKKFGPY